MTLHRLNIGCGRTPTEGWLNYDNSWSVRLAKHPRLVKVLQLLNFVKKEQLDFISYCSHADIKWADATKRIPLPSDSLDVLYCSHMLEHLDKNEVKQFLQEAKRVLRRGGIIRIAVPDLQYHVDNYLQDKDADIFISKLLLTKQRPKSLAAKLSYLLVSDRHHQWMYDGHSLCKLLKMEGFNDGILSKSAGQRVTTW